MATSNDIGARLIANFRDTLNEQVRKALARRIHAKVRDARGDPDHAARRWPFELVQNAHDAGPRCGREGISVAFDLVDGVLRFEHDAAPFSIADIAALLTGGSSKDFEARETTGRFGTGFLVTHALSERVQVIGVLEVEGEQREFEVVLERPDDEDLILDNIKDSESALAQTRTVAEFDGRPTVTVRYVVDDSSTALTGLDMLERALPHLFGTCRRLREIRIGHHDLETCWTVTTVTPPVMREGVTLEELAVFSVSRDSDETEWRVIRAAVGEGAPGRLVMALRRSGDSWVVSKPGAVANVFRQLPLIGAPTLSAWVIVDGEFEVDEERSNVHVVGDRGNPLREAFAALGGLTLLATSEGWGNGYRVGQLAMPIESLGDAATKIWREVLSSTAATLSRLPLVQTVRAGMLPSVQTEGHDRWVDFISQGSPGVSHHELWRLCAACTDVDPPVDAESEGWSEIAGGWEALGVAIPWIDLKGLGQRAGQVDDIAQLPVGEQPYGWLADYLDAVGKTWQATGVTKSHLARLLPDQHGTLRNPSELRTDGGVSDRVKAIAADIGLDLSARLVDEQLVKKLNEKNLEAGLYALGEVTGDQLTEDEAITMVVEHMAHALPPAQTVSEDATNVATATLALFEHLWTTRGQDARGIAWDIPLLAADGTARRAGERRLMVLPVPAWPEAARQFAKAYPASRVLADQYLTEQSSDTLLEALTRWGISHEGLLGVDTRDELRDRALRAIALNPDEAASTVLREPGFMQIALLEPEVINHCKQSRELAQALLGFVLRYVAPADNSWRSTVSVSVRTPAGERDMFVTPSLWLSDLRSKPWIPVEDEEEVTHHPPNPELIRELTDSAWLEGNPDGAELLVRHFGMDALEARLLAAASDEAARQRLRDGLAKIIEVAGDNPQMLEDLAAQAARRRQVVDRMRRLGLAVQERVKLALQLHGLSVQDVDHGYDLLVTAVRVREGDVDDVSAYFEVGEYKVEVKATTTGEARLTPLQAATSAAEPERFVLCVVDLRSFKPDVDAVDWSTENISPLCYLVAGATLPVDDTLTMVRTAEVSEVPARNTAALRYAIRQDLWAGGLHLDAWVETTFAAK